METKTGGEQGGLKMNANGKVLGETRGSRGVGGGVEKGSLLEVLSKM